MSMTMPLPFGASVAVVVADCLVVLVTVVAFSVALVSVALSVLVVAEVALDSVSLVVADDLVSVD